MVLIYPEEAVVAHATDEVPLGLGPTELAGHIDAQQRPRDQHDKGADEHSDHVVIPRAVEAIVGRLHDCRVTRA